MLQLENHSITVALWTKKSINKLTKINNANLLPLSSISKYLQNGFIQAQKLEYK